MNLGIDDIELNEDTIGLTFAAKCNKLMNNTEGNAEARLQAVEDLCADIAKEPSLIRRTEMYRTLNAVSGAGLATIKSTVNDLIDAEKRRLKEEGAGLGLQDGVDEKEALEFGIYEYKNRYWAIGNRGKYEITNFSMRVLYHVKTSDDAAYRIIIIKNVYGKESVINLNTDDFVSLGSFKRVIARFGNYIFKGADGDLAKLQEKIQRDEKPTRLVQTLGYNKRGDFYAFANGIVPCSGDTPQDVPFIQTDEWGIVEHNDLNFFIPANSKIFEDKEMKYTNDKKFVYNPDSHGVDFQKWAALMYQVHKEKAIVGILFYISAVFRDVIFNAIGRRFPMLFCYGQRGAGKGTFIDSYMWLFGKPQDQIMLGGKSTIVGYMRKLAQLCNALVWLDEYKNSIVPASIESIKNIYDGIGYERGKKDNTYESESTPVNSAVVLSGQEMPTAEPALFTRVIMLSFKPGKGFTDDDRRNFKALQQMQERNLSHITAYIARHRKVFSNSYKQQFETTFREIIAATNNREIDERMMLNIAVLAATYKIACTFLQFPYTYQQAESFLIQNMKEQFTILAGSDDIAKWWQVVENLFTQNMIKEGVEFELKSGYLYIKIQDVHPMYQKELRARNDPHSLDKSTLEHYLEMDATVFAEKTRIRFANGTNTSCFKFIYNAIGINLIRETDEATAKRRETEMSQPQPEAQQPGEQTGIDFSKHLKKNKTNTDTTTPNNDDIPF